MNVYIVIQNYPTLDLVDDDLLIRSEYFAGEIRGVYATFEAAQAEADRLQENSDAMVRDLDCDPLDFFVKEWEVNEGGE